MKSKESIVYNPLLPYTISITFVFLYKICNLVVENNILMYLAFFTYHLKIFSFCFMGFLTTLTSCRILHQEADHNATIHSNILFLVFSYAFSFSPSFGLLGPCPRCDYWVQREKDPLWLSSWGVVSRIARLVLTHRLT